MRSADRGMSEKSQPFPFKTAFAAAAVVFAAVGAVSGQAIGETPMLRGGTDETIPSATTFAPDYSRIATSEPLPDHYPLVTPEGTIPVGELALHGRLRDRDGGWYAGEDSVELSSSYADDISADAIEHLAHGELNRESPPTLETAGVRPEPVAGQARMIDVAAALQAQDDL